MAVDSVPTAFLFLVVVAITLATNVVVSIQA